MVELIADNVKEKTVTCEACGRTYFLGEWPFCPHDKPHYSWHFKGEKK